MIKNTDTIDVDVKRMYKYYYEEYVDKYFIEGENTSDYPCIDEDNYYYTDFSDYSLIRPLSKPNRVIETKKVYTYKERKTIRYIKISDIVGSNGKINFSEITIRFKDGTKINYLYTCIACSYDFLTYIKNGIENENRSYINNGGEIVLDLMNYYRFDEFDLEISIYDDTDEYKSFDITFYNELNGNIIMGKTFKEKYNCINQFDVPTYVINFLNMTYYDIDWSSVKETEEYIENSFTVEVLKVDTYYRFKDKYIDYYYVDRKYSDFQDGPTFIYPCESEEYILMYRYRTRDVISLDEDIYITDENDDLSNHIFSTTDYDILGVVNLNTNGTYRLLIQTYFVELEIKVHVSIELNNLFEKYNKLLMDYNNLLQEYHNLENTIIELQTENIDLLSENVSLTLEYDDLYNRYIDVLNLYDDLKNDIDNTAIIDAYNILLEEYQLLEEALLNAQNLNVANKEEYNMLVKEYQNLQRNYDELINTNNSNINNYDELKEKYHTLLTYYNETIDAIVKYREEAYTNEEKYDILNNAYNDLLDKYNKLENSLNEYKIEYQKLNDLKIEYEKLFVDKNNEIDVLIKEKEKIMFEYQDIALRYEEIEKELNNINKEDIKTYNKMIEELNNYKIKINELTNALEKCEKNIDLKEEEKNKITKEFENQLLNLKMSNKNDEISYEEEINIIDYKNVILIIVILSIIILLIGFFIKKFYLDKNKN